MLGLTLVLAAVSDYLGIYSKRKCRPKR